MIFANLTLTRGMMISGGDFLESEYLISRFGSNGAIVRRVISSRGNVLCTCINQSQLLFRPEFRRGGSKLVRFNGNSRSSIVGGSVYNNSRLTASPQSNRTV